MGYKELTSKKIMDFYEEYGLDNTLNLCEAMLSSPLHFKAENFYAYTQGEICEVVLQILVDEYIEENDLQDIWIPVHSLVLKDIDYYGERGSTTQDKYTEIDLVIFTPYKILAFECKNFNGLKTVTDRCTINRDGKDSKDVFSQHFNHAKLLSENFRIWKSGGEDIADVQLSYFDFSKGSVNDIRDIKDKRVMPIIDKTNLTRFLDSFRNKGNFWDIPEIVSALRIITSNTQRLHLEHLDYLDRRYNR